jgi:hypothetical protein
MMLSRLVQQSTKQERETRFGYVDNPSFVVDKLAPGHVFLRALPLSPSLSLSPPPSSLPHLPSVSAISLMCHIHIYSCAIDAL